MVDSALFGNKGKVVQPASLMKAALVVLEPLRHLGKGLALRLELRRPDRHQTEAGAEAQGVHHVDHRVGICFERLLASLAGKAVGAAHGA